MFGVGIRKRRMDAIRAAKRNKKSRTGKRGRWKSKGKQYGKPFVAHDPYGGN